MQTRIEATRIAPQLIIAASANQPVVTLVLCDTVPERVVGHQFLLVIVPFGSVMLNAPNEQLYHSLFEELTLAGYRPRRGFSPILNSSAIYKAGARRQTTSHYQLQVRVERLQLSAYDLLFIRRLKADIELSFDLYDSSGHFRGAWNSKGQRTLWHRFGFNKQLTWLLQQTLRDVASQAAGELTREIQHL